MFDSLLNLWGVKTALALGAGAAAFLFGPFHPFLIGLLTLVVIDLVTGIWKSLKQGEFNSHGLRGGVTKLITYGLLLIMGHHLASVSSVLLWIEEGIACFLALTEYESISENVKVIGGIKLPSIANLKALVKDVSK